MSTRFSHLKNAHMNPEQFVASTKSKFHFFGSLPPKSEFDTGQFWEGIGEYFVGYDHVACTKI
jgi:hypothetical protein